MAEDLMDKVFSFFSGDSGEIDDRKMLLKQTLKELGQNKYAKFFRTKTDEADSALAVFFFNVYKVTFPVRAFVRNEEKTARLKQMTLETFMDKSILEMAGRLNPAVIDSQAKTTAPAELTAQIQTDLSRLTSAFDSCRISGANRCYNLAFALFQMAGFNFPGFLKKFDPNFAAGNFTIEPKFAPISSNIIAKDLGEFIAVSHSLSPEGDWKTVLGLLNTCAGGELIQPGIFTGMLSGLRDVQQSKILELIVQYAAKNPVWQWKPQIPDEHIGEAWLEARQEEAQESIGKIASAQRQSQIDALTRRIFENAHLVRLENYTVKKGEVLRKRDIEDFIYAEGLNYLQAFLDDYLVTEIRELCDILLIRGQWTNNLMSKEMSESLHQLLEACAPIAELDERLAEKGDDGSRLKAAVMRVDRDRTQARYINSIVGSNNEEALEMISAAARNFIIIGKHLKILIEDGQKKHPELFLNWRELNLASKLPLIQRMTDDYKRINYFVQLMRLCTQ
ncbi:MAG: DUF5312 family protein [Treponema sp.]|jgi:hypothetical protein|nr:DUF5312 family protein [Treponema sp.]